MILLKVNMTNLSYSSWSNQGKIFNLGHGAVKDIFQDIVIIEEKIDGSYWSFGLFDGELKMRSKGVEFSDSQLPDKMFAKAVETVNSIKDTLTSGYTYRAEFLSKAKHNTLAYNRPPLHNLIIFDILTGPECYLSYEQKVLESARLGLECVPKLYEGFVTKQEELIGLLEHVSILGGQKIEGFVVKNYNRFGIDGKALFAKHVSEQFKEIHQGDWKDRNPGQNDIITRIVNQLKTPARYHKGIQHMRENGVLQNSPKDIGPLIKEVQSDILIECTEFIKEELFKWSKDQIMRGVTNPIPSFYKELLLQSQQLHEDEKA